jgi:hypothetical protein
MRVDTELEAFEGPRKSQRRCAESELALPSNQVEAGAMIRPVPLQRTSSTVHQVCSKKPRDPLAYCRWRRDPGKLIGETNLKDGDTPVIPQVS